MKDANTFLSFFEFNERYNIETNFLSFNGLVSSLKSLRERYKVSVHISRGGGEHSVAPGTFFVSESSNKN